MKTKKVWAIRPLALEVNDSTRMFKPVSDYRFEISTNDVRAFVDGINVESPESEDFRTWVNFINYYRNTSFEIVREVKIKGAHYFMISSLNPGAPAARNYCQVMEIGAEVDFS